MKKILLIITLALLFATSCQQQAMVDSKAKINQTPGETTGTASSLIPRLATSSLPVLVMPKGQSFITTNKPGKIQNNIVVVSNSSSTTYSNIKNNSTVITTSSSSSYSNIQDNSTIISNTSGPANINSSINMHLKSSDFPIGTVGQSYSYNINFSQTGNSQLDISFTGLPAGLGILSNGTLSASTIIPSPGSNPSLILSGTPTEAGQYNVTLKLDNKQGTLITQDFDITIN